MYAIVETGGKQYRVKPGDTIAVERLTGEPGDVLDLGQVLLVAGNGDSPRVGAPRVEGAVVRAEVVEHARGEKIIVFRYKSKVRYRRKTGHRQSLTRVRITDILLDGASSAPAVDEAPAQGVIEPETDTAPVRRHRGAPIVEEPAEPEQPVSEESSAPEPAVEPEPALENEAAEQEG